MGTGVTLALRGGLPVCSGPWPPWPEPLALEGSQVRRAYESGVWCISTELPTGYRLYNEIFSEQFRQFLEVKHCVCVSSGSAAVACALEAAGIGVGDEVIVPALTWPAPATAVLNINATPVLADVHPETLCLDVGDVARRITPRTAAVVPVHLYGSMVDMDALRELVDRHGLLIVEDAAHVHGASWKGRAAGTLGRVGCFSMQQSKVLTSGEGGAVVTNDSRLARRVEQLRADGRCLRPWSARREGFALDRVGELVGTNHCLGEIQAAMLVDGLERLPVQVARREAFARALDARLGEIAGVAPQAVPSAVTRRSIYRYAFRVDCREFADRGTEVISRAISAELGTEIAPAYPSLSTCDIFRPGRTRRHAGRELSLGDASELPVSAAAQHTVLTLHHSALLAPLDRVDSIVDAIEKVRRCAHLLT